MSTPKTLVAAPPPDAGVGLPESTFRPGIRLLPAPVRDHVLRLYHVLRTLDDLVDDEIPGAAVRVQAVRSWAEGTGYDATAETASLDALCRETPLSREPLVRFCEGMEHDIARAAIQTDDQLEAYCERAGGAVGVMLAEILGSDDPAASEQMAALGRAMQRTNILRDIDEDATRGRVYIPQEAIERYGHPHPGRREQLLRIEIGRADQLYELGLRAIPNLRSGGRAMALSAALYREILRAIERDHFGERPGRVRVSRFRRRVIITQHRLRPR